MSIVSCNGRISSKVTFSGVSPEGLLRLHDLEKTEDNVIPNELDGHMRPFNGAQSFFRISSAKKLERMYEVKIIIATFEAMKVDGSGREDTNVYFAPIPLGLLTKIWKAIDPRTLPETFEYISRG